MKSLESQILCVSFVSWECHIHICCYQPEGQVLTTFSTNVFPDLRTAFL